MDEPMLFARGETRGKVLLVSALRSVDWQQQHPSECSAMCVYPA